jgi:hypothetical protein
MTEREKINRSIESAILNKPNNYVYTTSDLIFFQKYDKCEDAGLDEAMVFGKLWDEAFDMIDGNKAENRFDGKVLVTHGGGGKAITSAPQGASFHVFNNDYFCHVITKALTSGRMRENYMNYDFGSIAEYFYLGNTDGLPQYDLVITHPPKQCGLAELDYDESMSEVAQDNARVYFAVRGFSFVKQGGAMMVIVPREEYVEVHEKITNKLVEMEGLSFDFEVPTTTGDDFILKYTRI